MAKRTINPNLVLREYRQNLSDQIKVNGIFLFGSYARGEAREESDIDCIVISNNFKRMQFMKRLQFLSRARKGKALDVAMDIWGYTPREFEELKKSDSPNVKKIFKEGKMIY